MDKKIMVLSLFILGTFGLHAQQQITPVKGMMIRKSVKIKKGIYALDGNIKTDRPVILIEGNNIVVDFNDAVLKGSTGKKNPDEFFGLAILINKGRNITIKNLNVRNYKVAIRAIHTEGLKIENCNLSYNYRQHLNSTQEAEDISDWMSYHQNEKDEWLRYGAAIYLRGCNNAIISNCRVTGGQNALMMTECHNATVYNNDFSFNSGIGIGMYKSSHNLVLFNRVNFNVRGYSHGVYNRGQDSAGILVYELSNNNQFYKNSVTHGGDGIFLWGGSTTEQTGKGGCNDNQIRENDFSYAPANGVEATFSRNLISGNRIFECDYGIWGGYSFNTVIDGNQFRNNRVGIAIEHGVHNEIVNNIFYRDLEAIRLWAKPQQPAGLGYAKYRDTRSAGYVIAINSFNDNPLVYNFSRTDSLWIFTNTYTNCREIFRIDSTVTHIDSMERLLNVREATEPEIKNPMNPFRGNAKLAGRKHIMITEWGPYDFGYPLIWNTNPVDSGERMQFDVLGPKGKWKILSVSGLEDLQVETDTFPSAFTARKTASVKTDIEIIAEYRGPSFTDQFGNLVPANRPVRFRFKKFVQPVDFTVKWYALDSVSPLPASFPVRPGQPVKEEKLNKLDFAWWGGIPVRGKQYSRFLTLAEGKAEFDPGTYEFGISWDDAVRVYVDGKRILDEWEPSRYKFDVSPHRTFRMQLKGIHTIRVEHAELGGFATLVLRIKKI